GVAIAWAVNEHLHNVIGCKTVFATHYHELTQLTEELAHARNFNVAVREAGDEIVFLHRLEPGGADRSYGIHVGRLAGLPDVFVAPVSAATVRPESRRRRGAPTVRGLGGPARPGVQQGRGVERLFRTRLGGARGREEAAVRPGPPPRARRRDSLPAADRIPPP